MGSGAALSKASARGDISMVKLLLDPKKFTWDFGEAVNQAIAANQSAVVELIHQSFPYQAYNPTSRKDTLITHMSRRGQSHIVEYLYERGLWALEDIPGAFVAAADSGHLELLQFLYDTELVSVETLNEAFEKTPSTEVATYLYDTNLILADTLKTVFLAQKYCWGINGGPRAEIVRVLLEERTVPAEIISEAASYAATWGAFDVFKACFNAGCYSTDKIIAAFKRAATHNLTNRLDLLDSEKCISNAVRGEALVASAKRGCYYVVKWLLERHRFNSEIITDAFVGASRHWHDAVMDLLYKDQQASTAVIDDLLQHAVSTGHFPVARVLMAIPYVTEAMKNEALLTVARRERRKDGAQKFIMKAHSWYQEILRQGLDVATDDKIKSILNGMIG